MFLGSFFGGVGVVLKLVEGDCVVFFGWVVVCLVFLVLCKVFMSRFMFYWVLVGLLDKLKGFVMFGCLNILLVGRELCSW